MKKEKSPYIEDIKEWQEKQYSPGEYLGGNMSPAIKSGSFFIPITLFAWGIFMLFFGIIMFFVGDKSKVVVEKSVDTILVFAGLLAIILSAFWFRMLLKKRK